MNGDTVGETNSNLEFTYKDTRIYFLNDEPVGDIKQAIKSAPNQVANVVPAEVSYQAKIDTEKQLKRLNSDKRFYTGSSIGLLAVSSGLGYASYKLKQQIGIEVSPETYAIGAAVGVMGIFTGLMARSNFRNLRHEADQTRERLIALQTTYPSTEMDN